MLFCWKIIILPKDIKLKCIPSIGPPSPLSSFPSQAFPLSDYPTLNSVLRPRIVGLIWESPFQLGRTWTANSSCVLVVCSSSLRALFSSRNLLFSDWDSSHSWKVNVIEWLSTINAYTDTYFQNIINKLCWLFSLGILLCSHHLFSGPLETHWIRLCVLCNKLKPGLEVKGWAKLLHSCNVSAGIWEFGHCLQIPGFSRSRPSRCNQADQPLHLRSPESPSSREGLICLQGVKW